MSSTFQLVEPHPKVNVYAHTGRGGAGNFFKAPKTSNGSTARGPASLFEHGLPKNTSNFSSGRGGAGNIHKPSERAIFSFDEELALQRTREDKMKGGAVYHVGRGGAGNFASTRPESSRKESSSSTDSNDSLRAGFFGRLSNHSERR